MTRQELIDYMRTLTNTPWMHQGRLPGIGVDCVGMGILAGRHFGIVSPDFDVTPYPTSPNEELFRAILRDYMTELPVPTFSLSNMVTLHLGKEQHVAYISRTTPETWIIHSYNEAPINKVVETILPDSWKLRARREFQFPGIEDQ